MSITVGQNEVVERRHAYLSSSIEQQAALNDWELQLSIQLLRLITGTRSINVSQALTSQSLKPDLLEYF